MERYVFPTLIEATMVIATFDLWMSRKGFDTFALVVNYINKQWETCHVIVRIFKVHETSSVTMHVQLKDLFNRYELLDKVLTYVKDEGLNLNIDTPPSSLLDPKKV